MNTNYLWLIGQVGIALEIIGAGLIVYFAYEAKQKVSVLKTDMDHLQEAIDTVQKTDYWFFITWFRSHHAVCWKFCIKFL